MIPPNYITEIKQIIISARKKAHTVINSAMIEAYWLIRKRIVEEEQNGKQRAEYDREVIKNLSEELQNEFGKGFAERRLHEYRQFCLNLTWSHFKLIDYVTCRKEQVSSAPRQEYFNNDKNILNI